MTLILVCWNGLDVILELFRYAPWYIIPSDSKTTARYLVSKILFETMTGFKDIKEPELEPEIQAKISEYKQQLERE